LLLHLLPRHFHPGRLVKRVEHHAELPPESSIIGTLSESMSLSTTQPRPHEQPNAYERRIHNLMILSKKVTIMRVSLERKMKK
jgi:hypothetical protein